jgi:hypothetical protein
LDAIGTLLDHLPDVASSPLAFIAYALVVVGWTLKAWLSSRPTRDARRILAQYKDDNIERTRALEKLLGEQPPPSLKGNTAILRWVRNRSADKFRVLLVVAWLATIIALGVFAIALRSIPADAPTKSITLNLYRTGTAENCPTLPVPTRIRVMLPTGKMLGAVKIIDGCKASLVVSRSMHGSAKVILEDAQPYQLTRSEDNYELDATHWHVEVSSSSSVHLLISLFSYSGVCHQIDTAFETFQQILRSKAVSLRGMFPSTDQRYDYLAGVNINTVGRTLDVSGAEVRAYWEQTASLQVLSGLCFVREGAQIMHSQIFSGPLAGMLPEPLVAELPISPEEFGATRDIHTVSILYALAHEAHRRRLDDDVVIGYLSRARAIVSQIHVGAADQLRQAIDQALQNFGAPLPMGV